MAGACRHRQCCLSTSACEHALAERIDIGQPGGSCLPALRSPAGRHWGSLPGTQGDACSAWMPQASRHLHDALGIQASKLRQHRREEALPRAAQPHGGCDLAGHEARDADVCGQAGAGRGDVDFGSVQG